MRINSIPNYSQHNVNFNGYKSKSINMALRSIVEGKPYQEAEKMLVSHPLGLGYDKKTVKHLLNKVVIAKDSYESKVEELKNFIAKNSEPKWNNVEFFFQS